MNFKAKIDALKGMVQAKITPESTPEELEQVNNTLADFDELVDAHNKVVTENANLKDTIVRMVSTQGSSDKPIDDSDGSKPKTIEECIAEELNKK